MTRGVALAIGLMLGQPAAGPPASCPPASHAPPVSPAVRASSLLTLARCAVADLDGGRWAAVDQRLLAAARASILIPDEPGRLAWQSLVARLSARRAIDGGAWASAAQTVLPHEAALPWAGPLVRGLSAARAAWAQQDAARLTGARRELERLESLALAAGAVSEAELARLVVQGAIAGAQYERDEMQLLMQAAHDLMLRLDGGDQLRPTVVLPREQEADLLKVTDRYEAAAVVYRDILAAHPARVQSRIGLADAYRRLGYTREADLTLAQARALWASADPEAQAALR